VGLSCRRQVAGWPAQRAPGGARREMASTAYCRPVPSKIETNFRTNVPLSARVFWYTEATHAAAIAISDRVKTRMYLPFTHPSYLIPYPFIFHSALCTLHSALLVHFRRCGRSLPSARRMTANSAARHRPPAAQTATTCSTRRFPPVHPPRILAQCGGSWRIFAITGDFNAKRNNQPPQKTTPGHLPGAAFYAYPEWTTSWSLLCTLNSVL
jgi:hypothetical protein